MSDHIPLSVPLIDGNEWQYVKECLDTGWVSSAGSYVNELERSVADYVGTQHAIACVNGTSALHIALLLLGVGPGDEVIVPTVTFIAPVNAIRYAGAQPLFMDCDEYYNLDAAKVSEFIMTQTSAEDGISFNVQTGRRIAALMPVHVFGNAADVRRLVGLCRDRGIRLLEDASESLGSWYRNPDGSSTHTGLVGELGCLSFNGNKIVTTGAGGMILAEADDLAARARYLTTQAKDDAAHYVHHEVGYNYRMSNVNAAIGVAQMEKLPRYLEAKRRIHELYSELLADDDHYQVAPVPSYADNNLWLTAVQIRDGSPRERDAELTRMATAGIECRPLWYLNHWQRPYARCNHYRIERAPKLWERTINVPSGVDLTEPLVRRVVAELKRG
jgi:aminotransferase in exopolysaccharide biosynthesis